MSLATSAQAENVGPYVILYLGVAASWVGVPIVGAGVLAAAGVLASEGELNLWLVIVVATVAAWTGGYGGYLLGARAGDALSGHPGRWQRKLYHAIGLGAYGVGSAILGQLSDRRGTIALAIAALTLTAIATAIWRRHESASNGEQQ